MRVPVNPWEGLYAPVPVFFTARGEVDEDAFRRVVARAADAGLDGCFVLTDPGEYTLLTREERRLLVEAAVSEGGSSRVFVGILEGRATEALAQARHADHLQASGLVVDPVGTRVTPDGLSAHLAALSRFDAPVFGLALDRAIDWSAVRPVVDGLVGEAGAGDPFVLSDAALACGEGAVVSPFAAVDPEAAASLWRQARSGSVSPDERERLARLDELDPPLWCGPALRRALGGPEHVRPPGGPLAREACPRLDEALGALPTSPPG